MRNTTKNNESNRFKGAARCATVEASDEFKAQVIDAAENPREHVPISVWFGAVLWLLMGSDEDDEVCGKHLVKNQARFTKLHADGYTPSEASLVAIGEIIHPGANVWLDRSSPHMHYLVIS